MRSSKTTLLDISVSSVFCMSNEDLAEAINKPRTRAAIVATIPIPNFTTSLESAVKLFGGKMERRAIPINAPPKTNANVIKLMTMELMKTSSHASLGDGRKNPHRSTPLEKSAHVRMCCPARGWNCQK